MCLTSKRCYDIQVDVPAFDWPMAPFPRYKYPLEENADYNKKQDDACLEKVRNNMKDNHLLQKRHYEKKRVFKNTFKNVKKVSK